MNYMYGLEADQQFLVMKLNNVKVVKSTLWKKNEMSSFISD